MTSQMFGGQTDLLFIAHLESDIMQVTSGLFTTIHNTVRKALHKMLLNYLFDWTRDTEESLDRQVKARGLLNSFKSLASRKC